MPTAPAGPRKDIDLKEFRRTIEGERQRLRDDLDKLDRQDEMGGSAGETGELAAYDQHPADQGTETFLQEQDQAIQETLQRQLDAVEASLQRMDAGTYGYCERCDEPIAAERLEALPFALYCIRCASELEDRL